MPFLDTELWDRLKKTDKNLQEQEKALVEVEIDKKRLTGAPGPGAKEELKLLDQEESRLQKEIARLQKEREELERAAIERDKHDVEQIVESMMKESAARGDRPMPPGFTQDRSAELAQDENLVKAEERLREQQAEQRADRVEEIVLKQVNGGEEKGLAETVLTLMERTKSEVGIPTPNEQMPEGMSAHTPDPTGLMTAMLAAKVVDLARAIVPGAIEGLKKLTEPDYLGKEERKELQQLKRDHDQDMDQLTEKHNEQNKKLDERLNLKQPDNADQLRDHLKQIQEAEKYRHTKEYVLEGRQVHEKYEKTRRAEGQKQLDLERAHKKQDKEHDHEH
jgi:hypothetical protein